MKCKVLLSSVLRRGGKENGLFRGEDKAERMNIRHGTAESVEVR